MQFYKLKNKPGCNNEIKFLPKAHLTKQAKLTTWSGFNFDAGLQHPFSDQLHPLEANGACLLLLYMPWLCTQLSSLQMSFRFFLWSQPHYLKSEPYKNCHWNESPILKVSN